MTDDDTITNDDGKLAYDTEGILSEMRKRVQWSVDFDADTRAEGLDDLRFKAGQQWPDAWRRTRELEARPCLTINKLPAFIHQISNDIRQNKPAIKIHPVDDDADIETARIIQGLIRHIEYSSNADFCYDTASDNAISVGFGFFRLVTEYCDEGSFDQDIRFKRIRNPFTVYCGPHQEPDGSDMQWCVISEDVPRDEFKREYPTADATAQANWPQGPNDSAIHWLSVDSVRVAEYYRIEEKPATLVMLADGTKGWKDDLPKVFHDQIVKERKSAKRVVMWRKCTAIDILDERQIPGRYIPIFPVYGDEIDLDGKVIRSGVIRWAKDPQRMYNYWMPLSLDTPIPTPDGWSTMGRLKVGDTVFSDTGELTKVVGKSPVHINRDCFRVTFGDGSYIDADAQHPWVVEARTKRKSRGLVWEQKKLRTDELDPKKHCIAPAKPLNTPDVDLPLDPYVLGVWLGDGTSASGGITASASDVEEMRRNLTDRGMNVGHARFYGDKAPQFTIHGIVGTLKALGVLGNKHIPAQYMRASVEQRLELLRGLMDTDGSAHAYNGNVAFSQADSCIAEQVRELAVSLGMRVGVVRRDGRVTKMANGHEIVSGESVQLSFTPPEGMRVFNMTRKAAVQMLERPRHARRGQHKIVSVERIASVPVQCIAIDAPSHLFLAGPSMIPTHNTASTEEVALRPKTPFIMAEGQDEGYEEMWAAANQRSFSRLVYKPTTIDGILVPPPQRSQPADIPSGTLAMAMHANDNIKATTGIFDASLGARGNETSGRAILARQREGDVSNFHYVDNLSRAIRHAGRVIVSWIPSIYDTQRIVRIMGEDDSLKFETVNKVEMAHEMDEFTGQMRAIETVLNDVRVGTYDVTVSMGPSYSTMRQEAAAAMVEFGQSWPKLMDIAGDKVVKAMDWPGAEEIAERIKKTIPPEITREKGDEEEDELPPQVVQQIERASQYIEMLQKENQMLKSETMQKAEDRKLEKYKIDVDATTKILLEEMKQAMAPLQDLGTRVQEMETALATLADVIVPAPAMGAGFTEGMPQ